MLEHASALHTTSDARSEARKRLPYLIELLTTNILLAADPKLVNDPSILHIYCVNVCVARDIRELDRQDESMDGGTDCEFFLARKNSNYFQNHLIIIYYIHVTG